jgi:putative tricarboxylic transport membrane protein
MSDLLANLAMGFQVAGNPFNILFCLLGVLVGTLVGVLPGVGSVATIAMLLPITFGLPPVGALIMLAGIYYGAQYGGPPPDPRSPSPPSAPSSPVAWPRCWWRPLARR